MSQQSFAGSGNITPSTLTGYLKANSQPTMDTLCRWQTVHGVNLNWLCTGEGEMFLGAEAGAAPLESGPCTQAVYPEASGAGATSFTQLAGRVNRLDPIAERIEVVSRELRACGAEPAVIQEAIFRAIDGRPSPNYQYPTGSEEPKAGLRAQEDTPPLCARVPERSGA